jgi:hypothetical protein
MSLQLHRPDGKGGLEPRPVSDTNWRRTLQSPRWGTSRPDGKLPALKNVEMNPTLTWIAVAFWVALAAVTFVVLVAGYSTGFWHPGTVPTPAPSVVPLP